MGLATFLPTLLLIVLLVVKSWQQQLAILHFYPEPDNYNYVELVCVAYGSRALSVVTEGTFQLNGTDIGEDDEIAVILSNGTVRLLLTQEKEGFFTCSYNESMSTNSIGLAGLNIMVVD